MQGGQITTNHTIGMDYVQERAHDEIQSARGGRARRHRPQHRQRFSWLHLGRNRRQHAQAGHSHAAPTASTAYQASVSAAVANGDRGSGRDGQQDA